MKGRITIGALMLFTILLTFSACRKKDAPLPDNEVQFEATEQGISESQNTITVKVKLTTNTTTEVPVVLTVKEDGGLIADYYTITPAVNSTATPSNTINLTIPPGSNEASLQVSKKDGVLFSGTEKLIISIYSTGGGTVIGSQKEFTLNFSEIISNGATMEIDGGGTTYPNKVFIDLSANKQTAVQRTKWDLGFYGGSDAFRVILNSSTGMMAKALSKTDLNTVSASDTIGFAAEMAFNYEPAALPYIDNPSGDLSKTAIAEIAANDADNKVYIINRGSGIGSPAPERGWKKVRIIRSNSGGYTIQYADIAATSFQSVDVPKDANYFFKYVSFDNGAVGIEPEAKKWDLAWTFFTNTTPLGPGVDIPYTFQDMILQNRNVQTAIVMNSTKSYADFKEADLANITLSSIQTAVGADWRSGGGPSTAPAVRTDRYYIIKDGDNNYYKIHFLSLTKNGVRGYPSFEYALIKKGEN